MIIRPSCLYWRQILLPSATRSMSSAASTTMRGYFASSVNRNRSVRGMAEMCPSPR